MRTLTEDLAASMASSTRRMIERKVAGEPLLRPDDVGGFPVSDAETQASNAYQAGAFMFAAAELAAHVDALLVLLARRDGGAA